MSTELEDRVRGGLRHLADGEPVAPFDVEALLREGHRRRRDRQRWLAGGVTAVVVLGVVAAAGVPRLRAAGDSPGLGSAVGPSTAPHDPSESFLGWVRTSTTASDFGLDVQRTLDNLDGVATRIQRQLGMPAVAPARPYDLDTELGSLQLAYRTADGSEVHVVVEGSYTASATASCKKGPPVPQLPHSWPEPTRGDRPRGSRMCDPAPVVATTKTTSGRLDRTVTQDVEPLYRGVVSVTVTSDAGLAAPTSVAAVAAVVEGLRPRAVFLETADSSPVAGLPLEQQLCMPASRWAVVHEAYLTTVDDVRRHTSGPGATPAAKPWAGLPGTDAAAWCVVEEKGTYRIVAATAGAAPVTFVTSRSPLSTDEDGPVMP